MIAFPPLARYRLYSSFSSYSTLLLDIVRGKLAAADKVAALESAACQVFGSENALATNQARVGVYLAVKSLVRPGRDEIVMSPYTIFDVVNMVICAGGRPVFADTEQSTCNIDPAEVEKLVTERTAAVLVTHLHGLASDVERIAPFCREKGVALVEDAAQAVGVRVGGQAVGTFGDAGVFSFGLMKNVNAFFGGMILSRDAALDEAMRRELSAWPAVSAKRLLSKAVHALILDVATWAPIFRGFTFWVFRYAHRHQIASLNSISRSENNPVIKREIPDGYRVRPSAAQARLATSQFGSLDDKFQRRLEIARYYHDSLSDIPEIVLPPLRLDGSHGYMTFAIQVPDRDALIGHLFASNRDCAPQHLLNCADLDCFSEFRRECPNARAAAESVLLLPTYPRYARTEAERTVKAVRSFFGR